jgi:hypothetical protein
MHTLIKIHWKWALVAHTCNLSNLGGWDGEDHDSMPDWTKKESSWDPISTEKKLGMVTGAHYPNYVGMFKIGRSQSSLAWAKSETLFPK